MENPIKIAISPEPFTGFGRSAKLENFVIQPDLEMIQQVRISYVDEEGVALLDKIAADPAIGTEQRQALQERYQDRIVTRQTRDAWIVPQTGEIVLPNTEGAISQVAFFQALTLGQIKQQMEVTDNTSFAQILYMLLGSEIKTMDIRGQL